MRTMAELGFSDLPAPEPGSEPGSRLEFPPLARFRFRLEAREDIRLPDYAGSAWRGLLGHGLRRTACVTRQPNCGGCLLIQGCVYSTLFETPPPPDAGKAGYTAMPHPFVLDLDPAAPRTLDRGAAFDLIINLIGSAIPHAPYLIHALGHAGELGIGRAHGRFSLSGVERETSPGDGHWTCVFEATRGEYRQHDIAPLVPPKAPRATRLRLVTPLRIKRDGHFVGAHAFAPIDLIRALYLRLRRLAELHGGDADCFDARQLLADPAALTLGSQRLRWHDWTRFSTRQNTLMNLGGLIGELELTGPALAALWPALWLGQWVHVGKGTAFGLGGYRLEPID